MPSPFLLLLSDTACRVPTILSFLWKIARLFVPLICRSKVLPFGIAKLMQALFCYSLTYSYLCQRHQGCMADIGLAENIPSNDLNRVVPA